MTQDDFSEDESIDLTQILHKALRVYKGSFQLFISLSLIYGIINEIISFIFGMASLGDRSLNLYKSVVQVLIAGWISIAMIYLCSRLHQRRQANLKDAFRWARTKYWRYLAIYLAHLAVMGIGFIFFIFPGIYFVTIFIFADILIVLEKISFIDAFRISAQLVRNYFWKVFFYIFVVIGVSLVPEIFYQMIVNMDPTLARTIHRIISVFIMPLLMIAQVELYYQIKKREAGHISWGEQINGSIS